MMIQTEYAELTVELFDVVELTNNEREFEFQKSWNEVWWVIEQVKHFQWVFSQVHSSFETSPQCGRMDFS